MANDDYTMDADELERLDTWIREKWEHGPCSICGANSWTTNPKVCLILNPASLVNNSSFPVVLIYCTNCGHTLFVNAIVAGVTPPEAVPLKPHTGSGAA